MDSEIKTREKGGGDMSPLETAGPGQHDAT